MKFYYLTKHGEIVSAPYATAGQVAVIAAYGNKRTPGVYGITWRKVTGA